jgi:hypothetical protein
MTTTKMMMTKTTTKEKIHEVRGNEIYHKNDKIQAAGLENQ